MTFELLVAIAGLQLGVTVGPWKFWSYFDDKFNSLKKSIAKIELTQPPTSIQLESEIKLIKAEISGLEQNTGHKFARVFQEIDVLKKNAGIWSCYLVALP